MDKILDCGHPASEHSEHFTGYGEDKEGKKYCYDCCAETERQYMRDHDKTTLYLTIDREKGKMYVSDWTGFFKIELKGLSKGYHNIAHTRYDIWFTFEGQNWHGVQYGEYTQICHCKRVK